MNKISLKNEQKEKIILGIDPGTNILGYGLIKVEGSKLTVLQYGVLHLSKYDADDHALKLKKIFDKLSVLIQEFLPDYMALEAPFYGKNIQSMLKLGRAQGVAIAAALARDIPVIEYAPRKVKQSVTGSGSATKEQVASMIQNVFSLKELPELFDATDALAVALCHHYQNKITFGKEKSSSWSQFLAANPDKVKK